MKQETQAQAIVDALESIHLDHGGMRQFDARHGGHREQHRHGHHRGRGAAYRRLLLAVASHSGPLGVSELGAAVGVDQPRASRLVAQGVEAGLLRREVDPDDARRTVIVFTAEGNRVVKVLQESRIAQVSAALDGFTDSEKEQLAQLLSRLALQWPAAVEPELKEPRR